MDNFKNRIGYDNFVWWIGVVEDREDPLKLGRCRVRIFGSHTENLQLIPTDTLPWAIPVYPVNNSRNWASPNEGEYVFGFFQDGLSCQAPVMMGVFPGVTQGEPKAGTGFSSLAKKANIVATASSNAVTTTTTATMPAAATTTAATTTNTNTTTPTEPSVPKNAPAMVRFRVGEPTTPTNAYSANGTMLQITNSQVSHACDFRFLIDFPNLDIGVIQNPIALIEQSIKNAKNKAAAIIRTMLAQIIDNFRLILKGVTIALNLDPTGQIAKAISLAREAIRTINYYSKKLAEIVGNAALMIALLSQLKQIIEWIKSLPANILAMLQGCLTNFQSAITSATTKISLIPGQISNSVEDAFKELQTSTISAIAQSQIAEQSANVPNNLISIVNSPDTANLNVISQYITSQFPSANVVISDANGAAFNVANSSTP
jgi:hypothetical protein